MTRRQVCLMRLSILVLAVALGCSIARPAQVAGGAPSDEFSLIYDFETGAEGWGNHQGAITNVEWTADRGKSSQHALRLTVDLRKDAQNQSSGSAHVDMGASSDLSAKTVSAWVYAPPGARGDLTYPNRIRLFAGDQSGRRLYGTWRNLLEGGWFQVTLLVTSTTPACGHIAPDFQPFSIQAIGVEVINPLESAATFSGSLYLDRVEFGVLSAPKATHLYDFEHPQALDRHPNWAPVPNWGALALGAPAWHDGALAMPAHFTVASDATRKGAVGITYSPPLDLAHKDHAIISADVRFEPSAITPNTNCPFIVSIWAYDDHRKKWFVSDDLHVGASAWTRISFDLGDTVHYKPGVQDYTGETATLDAVRQVVFQFWANAAYNGELLIDNIAVGGLAFAPPLPSREFVRVEHGQFVLNGQPFRFVGANAEYLFNERGSTVEQILDRAAALGVSVVRTWGFGEGCEDPTLDNCVMWSRRFQPARGRWNETTFQRFDQIVAMAAERGIRLIVPLANNWDEYGGRPQYVAWLEEEHPEAIPSGVISGTHEYDDLFYTDPHVRQWYKDYVTHFITRTNSITGIPYRDDPTIFAWELINEPRATSDKSGATVHEWLVEMSEFVDRLDPNHLIGTGEEGWHVMTKARTDKRARLPDGTVWQNLPGNYWQYGVNWKPLGEPPWSSDGVDFISDHSSTDTNVCWQEYAGETEQTEVRCELRKGVPKIDFASMHLYIYSGASTLYHAPYCAAGFDSTICNPTYDRPYHQAFLWIAKHISDTIRLGKPLIIGEFGFPTSGRGAPASHGVPRHVPPFEPHHRAQLFSWYLDEMYRQGVAGALFWNMGVDGFPESLWDGAEVLTDTETVFWRYNDQTDATSAKLCPGPRHVVQGRYSVCVDYDPGKGSGKAFVDRVNISPADRDWSPAHRHRFRVDIYSQAPVSATIALVTGESQTSYELMPQSMTSGWNTITVDTTQEMWKSAATNGDYNGIVHNLDAVRQVSIGITNYAGSGTLYVDHLRHVGNDSLALYPGDPALAAIRDAICKNWRPCLYLSPIHR